MSMMRLSEAAKALEATLQGQDVAFDSVGTDTRALGPRALFVALRGERFDGHDFLQQAAQQGAVAALVDRSGAGETAPAAMSLVVVDDSRKALGRPASFELFQGPKQRRIGAQRCQPLEQKGSLALVP